MEELTHIKKVKGTFGFTETSVAHQDDTHSCQVHVDIWALYLIYF